RLFLLEAAFMFLVNDDQAKVAGRSEDGTASTDHHLHLAAANAPPVRSALAFAQMAVQHRDLAATTLEALDRLRRQADFRHQDEGLLALLERFLDGTQVQFRLAAAGHAEQQE